jgi:hypothetical protein
VIPKISGSQSAYCSLPACCANLVDMAASLIVSVELAELAPGVTDAGERAQVGIGAGPVTTQES